MAISIIAISVIILAILIIILYRRIEALVTFNCAVSAFLYDEFGMTTDDILDNYWENYMEKGNNDFLGKV